MMVTIVDIGMNHETAPVEMRECLTRDLGNPEKALMSMREVPAVKESLFISTCNRVEVLFTCTSIKIWTR